MSDTAAAAAMPPATPNLRRRRPSLLRHRRGRTAIATPTPPHPHRHLSGCPWPSVAALYRYGWETITEALKFGGVGGMVDRLDNPSKLKCVELADELKVIMQPLYQKHQVRANTPSHARAHTTQARSHPARPPTRATADACALSARLPRVTPE